MPVDVRSDTTDQEDQMFKRPLALLAASAGLAGSAFALAPTAEAAPVGCYAGALCAYYSSSYQGSVQRVYQNNDDLTMYNNFYRIQGGSLYNNGTQCNVTVYPGKYGTGGGHPLNRGTGWTSIGSNLPYISSNYWC